MSFRYRTLALLIAMIAVAQAFAADTAYQVNVTQETVDNQLTVTFWIGNASPGFVLATAGFKIGYNPLALGCPAKIPTSDGPWDQQTDADYDNMTLVLHDGYVVELHTRFIGGTDFTGAMVPTGTPVRIGAVRFSILNPSEPALLAWSQPYVYRLNSPGTQPSYEILYTAEGDFIPPDDVPLPVTLTSFTGTALPDGDGVALDWRTISEINNYGFTVQRRSDGAAEFSVIPNSFLPGGGTTVEPRAYAFVDRTIPAPGRYEYRLMQQDLGGGTTYSSPIIVTVALTAVQEAGKPIDATLVRNYPNPFNPETTIRYGVADRSPVTVEIYTMLGQKVRTLVNTVQESGNYAATWDGTDDAGQGLRSGTYVCRVTSAGTTASVKMLLLR